MCIRDSIYSVLVNGESVCAGYARTTQYLLERLNVFCTYVTGTATVSYTHLDVYKRQADQSDWNE